MSMQNHIHLAIALGGAPEYSPIHTWGATAVEPEIAFFSTIRYTPSGGAFLHTSTVNGVPTVRMNFDYALRLRAKPGITIQQQIAWLKEMAGQRLYLVDHDHCANGADHTPYVYQVALGDNIRLKPGDPMRTFYNATVSLRDIGDL